MKRVALVVGNGAYRTVPALRNPKNDAEAMAKVLTDLKFEVDMVFDADRAELAAAVQRFGERSDLAVGLLFYAGHGLQMNGRNYLIPVDARVEREVDLGLALIEVSTVTKLMEQVSAIRLVFLDACRDNPIARTLAGRIGGRSIQVERGLAGISTGPGETLIAFSTAPGEVAEDGSGVNSPFTAALIAHLPTPGVSVQQILTRVRKSVMDVTGNKQIPWDHSSLTEFFYFVEPLLLPPPPPVKIKPTLKPGYGVSLDIKFWDSIKGSDNPAEFQAYLDQFPNGAFVNLARIRLEAVSLPRPVPRVSASPTQAGQVFREFPNGPELVVIPAGTFLMGSSERELGSRQDEGPRHRVSFVQPFALGCYAVTFEEWDACVAEGGGNGYKPNDQGWDRDRHPVINVSWDDAQAYLQWLNAKVTAVGTVSIGGNGPYRLPSEAEWEYAARAGTTTAYYWGDDIGRNNANGGAGGGQWDGQSTAPVGSFAPNRFGVYDMLGNVWEWIEDCWHDTYEWAPQDGRAWTANDCKSRVLRGGSWCNGLDFLRSAYRSWGAPDDRDSAIGFRVARTITS